MSELWDIYDINGNLTGETVERGKPLKPGQYHIAVDVWIVNSKSEILIQKRSVYKDIHPNIWAAHGGSVIAGESSMAGCIREAKEEIGIDIDISKAKIIKKVIGECTIWDIWLIEQEFDIKDAVLQVEEVSDIKWATADEIIEMVNNKVFFNYNELQDMLALVQNRR